jgi:hypothetical protein
MVSTLIGWFAVVSCLSATVLHYAVHQHFAKWECGVTKAYAAGCNKSGHITSTECYVVLKPW